MKRKISEKLNRIKEKSTGLNVIMSGVRGVGKTYSVLDFARSAYPGYIYINFENDLRAREYIKEQASSISRDNDIIAALCELYDISASVSRSILFIFDEYTCLKEAKQMLFDLPYPDQYNIIAISSFKNEISPIKGFTQLTLYPLDFDEFMTAVGNEWYIDIIRAHFSNLRKIPEIVHSDLLSLFNDYLAVGGMPLAVNDFAVNENMCNTAQIHRQIYTTQLDSVLSHAPEEEKNKITQVLSVLPLQLLKDNRKFKYSLIRKGLTYNNIKNTVDHLSECGYITKCCRLIDSTSDPQSFKLYYYDTGILGTLLQNSLIYKNTTDEDFLNTLDEIKNGAYDSVFYTEEYMFSRIPYIKHLLIENLLISSLSRSGKKTIFWESGSGARADVVLQTDKQLVPFEIKEEDGKRSKGINVFLSKFSSETACILSENNFSKTIQDEKKFLNIPFYALHYEISP